MVTTTVYGTELGAFVSETVQAKVNNIYGLGFPVGATSGAGFFYKQANLTLLKNNIKQFLSTIKGERVMLPSYGLNLIPFLFQPLDEELVDQIKYEITTQIGTYFPSIQIAKLRLFESDSINYLGGHGLKIELDLIATNFNNNQITVETTVG